MDNQKVAIRAMLKVIVQTVHEMGPRGAPSGPICLVLQEKTGMTTATYQTFIEELKKQGILTVKNHVLFCDEQRAREFHLI